MVNIKKVTTAFLLLLLAPIAASQHSQEEEKGSTSEEKKLTEEENQIVSILERKLKKAANAGQPTDEAVIFIGRTGVGKSTLTRYLQLKGENFYAEIDDSIIEYDAFLIKHKDKAIDSLLGHNTESCTKEVKKVTVASNSSNKLIVCDCPGFGDTSGTLKEFQNAEHIRDALQGINKSKIVLVIEAKELSGKCGPLRQTLQLLSGLFKPIERLTERLFLVVTKGKPGLTQTRIKKQLQRLLKEKHCEPKQCTILEQLVKKETIAFFPAPQKEGPIVNTSAKEIGKMLASEPYIPLDPHCIQYNYPAKVKLELKELANKKRKEAIIIFQKLVKSLKPEIKRLVSERNSSSAEVKKVRKTLQNIENALSKIKKKDTLLLMLQAYPASHLDILRQLNSSAYTTISSGKQIEKLQEKVNLLKVLHERDLFENKEIENNKKQELTVNNTAHKPKVNLKKEKDSFESKQCTSEIENVNRFINKQREEFVRKQEEEIMKSWEKLVDTLKLKIKVFVSQGTSSSSVKEGLKNIKNKLSKFEKENYETCLKAIKNYLVHHLDILKKLKVTSEKYNPTKELQTEVAALEAFESVTFSNNKGKLTLKLNSLKNFTETYLKGVKLEIEKYPDDEKSNDDKKSDKKSDKVITLSGYLITGKEIMEEVKNMDKMKYHTIKIYCGNTLYLEGTHLTFPGKNLYIFAPTWQVTCKTTISTRGTDMAGGHVIARGKNFSGIKKNLTIDTSGGHGKDADKKKLDKREEAKKYLLKSRVLGIGDKWKKSATSTVIHGVKTIATYTAQIEETYQVTGNPGQSSGVCVWRAFEKRNLEKWEKPTIISMEGKIGKTCQRKYILELVCPLSLRLRPDGKGKEVNNQAQLDEYKNDEEDNIDVGQGIGAASKAGMAAGTALSANAAFESVKATALAGVEAAKQNLNKQASILATKKIAYEGAKQNLAGVTSSYFSYFYNLVSGGLQVAEKGVELAGGEVIKQGVATKAAEEGVKMAATQAAAYNGAKRAVSILSNNVIIPLTIGFTVVSVYASSGWDGDAFPLPGPPPTYHKGEIDLYRAKPRKKVPYTKEEEEAYFKTFDKKECAIKFVRDHMEIKKKWEEKRNKTVTPGRDFSDKNIHSEEIEDDEKQEQLDQPGADLNNVPFKPHVAKEKAAIHPNNVAFKPHK